MGFYKNSIIKLLLKILKEDITFDQKITVNISGRRLVMSSITIFPEIIVIGETCCKDSVKIKLTELEPADVIKLTDQILWQIEKMDT